MSKEDISNAERYQKEYEQALKAANVRVERRVAPRPVPRSPVRQNQNQAVRPRHKRRRRRYRLRLRAKIILALLLLLIVVLVVRCVGGGPRAELTGAVDNPLDAKINSVAAIVYGEKDNKVLYEKNADVQCYPASLTKLMTLYVAIEAGGNPNRNVSIPAEAILNLSNNDAAMAGLSIGEQLAFKDLLYAMMLPSGADAALSVGILVGGDEEHFVGKMNKAAEKLGMSNTYFTNCTGLHDPRQITTARDMSKLVKAGLKNELFKRIVTTSDYTSKQSKQHPAGLDFMHTVSKQLANNQDKLKKKNYEIIGGKTGYTPEAGLCLFSIAQHSDKRSAWAVTLNASGDNNNYLPVLKDAYVLYDDAFSSTRRR